VNRAPAAAKINLALLVGPTRSDGKHEVTTLLQRIDLLDRIRVEEAPRLRVRGFADDTIVARALSDLAATAGVEPRWEATITKRVPVAGGLGGGSSDAATALRLANATLPQPLSHDRLHELARALGADVPFFLAHGPQLGRGDGSELAAVELPQDYWIVLVLPWRERKPSTADVYARFDRRDGPHGYETRRDALLALLPRLRRPRDLARLPANDLASSQVEDELRALGAVHASVSGAGPAVYGLFVHFAAARRARRHLRRRGRTWLTVPTWYG
jgi:4-diphosphocytidyl-2-C-methyl-D-erythritol kinase